MFKAWQQGFDIVYGIRRNRKEMLPKRALYNMFYRILAWLTDFPVPRNSGDFCLMNRRAVDVVNALPERQRFVRGLRAWTGLTSIGAEYDRPKRARGETKYSFCALLLLALDGMTNFSIQPLRLMWFSGIAVFLASILLGAFMIIWRLSGIVILDTNPTEAQGWASLVVLVLFFGGINLLAIGLVGEYLGRMYHEIERRPLCLVQRDSGNGAPLVQPVPAWRQARAAAAKDTQPSD